MRPKDVLALRRVQQVGNSTTFSPNAQCPLNTFTPSFQFVPLSRNGVVVRAVKWSEHMPFNSDNPSSNPVNFKYDFLIYETTSSFYDELLQSQITPQNLAIFTAIFCRILQVSGQCGKMARIFF